MVHSPSGSIEVSMMSELLKARFSEHKELHPDLEWFEAEQRLREFSAAIAVLQKLEENGRKHAGFGLSRY